jgi:uncharacterized protein YwgA
MFEVGDILGRSAWLQLFVALEGAPDGLDPVRVQYGMFLFTMEGQAPESAKYTFEPYDYGPMSPAIYSDLDELVRQGLLVARPVEGKRWSRYGATNAGLHSGARTLGTIEAEGHAQAVRAMHRLKLRVSTMSFDRLLDDVYERYPEYTVNSVFRRVS